jgi:glycosyltransferase involved in cell wall biosynthesis
MVQAMPEVLASLPRARLVVLKHEARAEPEYLRHVESLIDSLGLRSSIHLLPALEYAEMPRYLSAADCTISIPDTDGTPMTVMESLACGTPAIVHDLPDYDPEIFVDGRTVLRVPLRDPRALAQAIVRLCRDSSLRETLIGHGTAMVQERANYETEMGRLEQLYRQVLSKPA